MCSPSRLVDSPSSYSSGGKFYFMVAQVNTNPNRSRSPKGSQPVVVFFRRLPDNYLRWWGG